MGGSTIFGLLFTGVGLIMFVQFFRQFRTSKKSKGWPSAEGRVVEAMVEQKFDTDADRSYDGPYSPRIISTFVSVTPCALLPTYDRRYSPRIIYTYSVYGQAYTSGQVDIGARRWYSSQARAEARLTHRPEQRVTVYYDPDNPAQAVLEAGFTRGAWGTFFIGIGFAAIGMVALVDSIQKMMAQ